MGHIGAGDTIPRNDLLTRTGDAFAAGELSGGQAARFAGSLPPGGTISLFEAVEAGFDAGVPASFVHDVLFQGVGGSSPPPPPSGGSGGQGGDGSPGLLMVGALALGALLLGRKGQAKTSSKGAKKRRSKTSAKRTFRYRGKTYTRAQAKAGFAGPANRRQAGG